MINKRMRFGIFLAPFHAVEENPTNAIERDFELVEHLDNLGYDGDFIESQAFAFLAIRSYLKLPISFPETTGCTKPTTGGKIIKFK